MNRRDFFKGLAAGGIVVAGELWIPGKRLISIPSSKVFETPPNTVEFTVSGLVPGDRVYAYLDDGTEINIEADDTTFRKQIQYCSEQQLFLRVRNGGISPIRTFETSYTINEKGLSIPIIRTPDV